MPVQKLKKFLDENGIRYVSVVHSPTYTAQEVAARVHIRGRLLAKTVIVKMDGKMAMVVLPASHQIDFDYLKRETGSSKVELAKEEEFEDLFPGCEVGAMPPFGNLYGMEVFTDQTLSKDDEIAFSAGTHSELMKLRFEDFKRLVQPKMVRIT
ncbi:MAG: YbaK/EbsC family protein [Deltaproteobacteria bacterium]|nr:YbaK/EbsC family protein [Deltaproteobacteria bacterium]